MVSPAVVLVPLYIYPLSGAWNFLTQSISANPNLNFQVIVNPHSGPGTSTYPDSNYITNVARLNKYHNVNLVGYVYTSYAARPVAAVEKDISLYAGWAKYKLADIHLSGIFFDEVNSTAVKPILSYMNTLSTYTKRTFGSGRNAVIFNPGTDADAAFYNYADLIVVWEDSYSKYSTSDLTDVPQSLRKKSGIIIHDFPANAAAQTTIVKKIISLGYNSLMITTSTSYEKASKVWAQFCSSITALKVQKRAPGTPNESMDRVVGILTD